MNDHDDLKVIKQSIYEWTPQPDITVYELALALPVLINDVYWAQTLVDALPENVQRHFVRVKDDGRPAWDAGRPIGDGGVVSS